MKNANIHLDLKKLFKPVGSLFRRFHLTLFIVFITAGLSYAVYTFTNLLNESSIDSSYVSPHDAGTIDQATLDRIKALHTSDEPIPASTLPAGRVNPFSE